MSTLADMTRRHLGWERLQAAFLGHFRAPVCRAAPELALAARPLACRADATLCFSLQADLEAAIERGGAVDLRAVDRALGEVEDLRPSMAHVAQGGVLDVLELAGIIRLLEAAVVLRGLLAQGPEGLSSAVDAWTTQVSARRGGCFTAGHESAEGGASFTEVEACAGDGAPGDPPSSEDDGSLDGGEALLTRLRAALVWTDAGPTLRDDASEGLRVARARLAAAQRTLSVAAGDLLKRLRDSEGLQDDFWTEREGRVVVPVRSDGLHRLRDDGAIVHGASGSGQTLFVEPTALIVKNNAVKAAQRAVNAEIRAVLEALSDAASRARRTILSAQQFVVGMDELLARVRFGQSIGGSAPTWADVAEGDASAAPAYVLHQARHPGMALDGSAVVPFDLQLEVGSALIVSGPNAGGKTVALKTLGACVLLAQAGLRMPCGPGSQLVWGGTVVTSVGDDQSIAASLSTFTAQLSRIQRALDVAGAPGASPLVLLDEIAAGTEPVQGAALAEAVVRELVVRGATVFATTHYETLKVLGTQPEDPLAGRVRQASVGFDMARMQPTYELIVGVPGASSALEVARRVGLDAAVVERAQTSLDPQRVRFDALVRTLTHERGKLAEATAALEVVAARQEQRGRALDAREAKIEARASTEHVKAHDRAVRALNAFEGEAKRRRKALRSRERAASGDATRAFVAEGDALLESHRPRPRNQPAAPATLSVGLKVRVKTLDADGEIVSMRGNRVEVQMPNCTVSVGRKDLAVAAKPATRKPRRGKAAPVFQPRDEAPTPSPNLHFDAPVMPFVPGPDDAVDIRGLRGEEAWSLTQAHLAERLARGREVALVIHGVGDGILRRLVRSRLPDLIEVRRFREGLAEEGGVGVTVVHIDL